MIAQVHCYTSNNKKWHHFNNIPFREGDICVCGEMKVINGVVTKIEKDKGGSHSGNCPRL